MVFTALAAQPPWRDDLDAGRGLAAQGNYQEPETKLLAAVREAQASGPGSAGEALACTEAATLYQLLGRCSRAETFYQRAIRAWESTYREDKCGLIQTLSNLTGLYWNLGQFGKAELTCRRALALEMEAPDLDAAARVSLHANLAGLYFARHKYAAAESEYLRAQALWGRHLGPDRPAVLAVLNNLSVLYAKTGRLTEAIFQLEKAVAIGRGTSDLADGSVLAQLDNLGTLYTATGRLPEAERAFKEAFQIADHYPAFAKPRLPDLLWDYAALLGKLNRRPEAKAFKQQAQAISREVSLQDPNRYTVDARDLIKSATRGRGAGTMFPAAARALSRPQSGSADNPQVITVMTPDKELRTCTVH